MIYLQKRRKESKKSSLKPNNKKNPDFEKGSKSGFLILLYLPKI
jgi:hypothetical protein